MRGASWFRTSTQKWKCLALTEIATCNSICRREKPVVGLSPPWFWFYLHSAYILHVFSALLPCFLASLHFECWNATISFY